MLKKDLGFVHMTALTVGMMLGVGIFFGPTLTAREFPNDTIVLALWTAGGVVALCGAWLFGRLAALYPLSGGPYVYVREAFGPAPAFLFAWTSLVIIAPTSAAVMAHVFGSYLSQLSPLSVRGVALMAVWALVAFAFFNVLGVKLGGRVQAGAMALKIVLLGAVVALLAFAVRSPAQAPAQAPALAQGRWSVAAAGVLFAFGGWDYAVLASEEVRDGSKTIPRAMMLGAGIVTVLYILATISYLAALGAAGIGASNAVASDAAASVAPAGFAFVVAIGVALSAAGTINAVTLLGPRATFAVARDGSLPRPLARLSPWGTPVAAIALQLVLTIAFLLVGAPDALATTTVLGTAFFIVLSTIALFVLRKRAGARRAHPIEIAAGVLIVAVYSWFVLSTIVDTPIVGLGATALVAAGLIPYFLLRRRRVDA